MDGSAHLLTSVLQALQTSSDRNTNIQAIVNNSALTLSRLTNPLNVSLLTTQILAAPALWSSASTSASLLPTCTLITNIFRMATVERARQEPNRSLSLPDWISAILAGLDARVPRWKHTLPATGLLIALDPADARVPYTLRANLEAHLIDVANLHFEFLTSGVETHASLLAICNTFPFLSEDSKYLINYPALTSALLPAMFLSTEGYQTGDFLRQIDRSVPSPEGIGSKLTITPHFSLKEFFARPLIVNIGALARLAGTSMALSPDPDTINGALSVLATYSRSLIAIWRDTKLSVLLEDTNPNIIISNDPAQTNPAQLWQVLKASLFSAVVVLENIIKILLGSHGLMRNGIHASASQILCILRDMYFIIHKTNPAAFATYNFVYHACVDIVLSSPPQAESLAAQLAPMQLGTLPTHPADLLRDLYYLNTLEHLVPACSPAFCNSIVSPSLIPYLTATITPAIREPFESAHALMLAMIGCPQLVESSYKILPSYIESVFAAYPSFLSTRQFRLAISSMVKFTSPPTALSVMQRDLPDIVLEMLCARIEAADGIRPVESYRPPPVATPDGAAPAAQEEQEMFTERDACVLALLDSLPFMEEAILEKWLEVAAGFVGDARVKGDSREVLRGRFWDVISGELDVGRSQLAIPWWSEGGREAVLGIAG